VKIGIIDYGAGNLRSVRNAFEHLGADFFVSDDPTDFSRADQIVFPGVGEARAAMENLVHSGFDVLLKARFAAGSPILGICLGCQIVLDSSEESETLCLGLVPGRSLLFPGNLGLKVPHMGWNRVHHGGRHPLFAGIPEDSYFYFVHSYYPTLVPDGAAPGNPPSGEAGAGQSAPAYEIGSCEYGVKFPAAFARGHLAAMQFHPEKSGEPGLALLGNFIGGALC
jgi:imidazole glycerol-phosphate synthase subunit HisH